MPLTSHSHQQLRPGERWFLRPGPALKWERNLLRLASTQPTGRPYRQSSARVSPGHDLEPWAKAQVERLIAPLGNRWEHVQAVGRQAWRLAAVFSAEAGDGLPARAIDALMGHERSRHEGLDGGSSRIGARYWHTTPEMAIRVVNAIQERLTIALRVVQDTSRAAGKKKVFLYICPMTP